MPAWAQSGKLVEAVAHYNDPRIIQELVRNGIKHPESLADNAPLAVARNMAELSNAVGAHQTAVRKYINEGGSLHGLMNGLDEVQPVVLVPRQVGAGRVERCQICR